MQCEHLHFMEINNRILVRGYKFSSIHAAVIEISSEPDWLVILSNKKLEQTRTPSMHDVYSVAHSSNRYYINQLVTATSAAYVKTGECTVNFKDQSKEHRCMIFFILLLCRMTKLSNTATPQINNMAMIQATTLLRQLLLISYVSQVRSFFFSLLL